MLSVKKIDETKSYVLYEYFPEDKTSFGLVKVEKGGLGEIVKIEGEYGEVYALKALELVSMFSEENRYPEDGRIEWF